MTQIIKFSYDTGDAEYGYIQCLVLVKSDTVFTNGTRNRMQEMIDKFVDENDDWQFDDVVSTVCHETFDEEGIEWEELGIDMELNW